MAVLPTIANTFRVTLNWHTAHGITPRNVLHILAPSANEVDVANEVDAAFVAATNCFQPMCDDFNFDQMDVIKLDGSSATQTVTVPDGIAGGESGDCIPAACCVVGFHTLQRGARGRGRIYIGPIAEVSQTQGILTSSALTDMASSWATFHDHLITNSMALVVASYVHADQHEVTSVHIDSILGTQRRRLIA